MFQSKRLSQTIAVSCILPLLAACGAGEQGEDRPAAADESRVEVEPVEAAPAPSATPVPSSAPGLEERTALIAAFRDQAVNHCPFYKDAVDSSATGDLQGARIQMCTGRFSGNENFGLITNLEGGPFEPGTVLVTVGANGEAGAFAPLWTLVGELAQMDAAELSQLRQEMPGKLRYAANLFSVEYEPLMTTRSGVELSFGGNMLQQSTLTIKIDPPS